jgi:hypothetical protein
MRSYPGDLVSRAVDFRWTKDSRQTLICKLVKRHVLTAPETLKTLLVTRSQLVNTLVPAVFRITL